MKCINEISVINKKTKKPMIVPCGECIVCIENNINQWKYRVKVEYNHQYDKTFMITLTYNDENLVYLDDIPVISKRELQLFFKKLRREIERKSHINYKIKYLAVGEYGDKYQRPHYHIILFGLPYDLIIEGKQMKINRFIEQIWNKGFIDVKDFHLSEIMYVLKYVLKYKIKHKKIEDKKLRKETNNFMPFTLVSKKPSIGVMPNDIMMKIDKKINESDKNEWRLPSGSNVSLPRYYRKKLSEETNEKYRENVKKYVDNVKLEDLENTYINKAMKYKILEDETLINIKKRRKKLAGKN